MANNRILVFMLALLIALALGSCQQEPNEVTRVVTETEQVEIQVTNVVTRIVEVTPVEATPAVTTTEEVTATEAVTNTVAPTPVGEEKVGEGAAAPAADDSSDEDNSPAALAVEEGIEDVGWTEFADGLIALGGFPEESTPARWAGVVQPNNACVGPDEGCWIFADEGVLSYDHIDDDSRDNLSAVWTGGPDVANVLEQPHSRLLIPDGGYFKATFGDLTAQVDGLAVRMEPAPEVGHALVIRGYFHEEERGLAPISLITENPGGVHTIRYPVPPGYNGFYSGAHILEDISNMLGDLRGNADNCDYDGCNIIYLTAVDINNDTVSVWKFDASRHELVYSNAVRPTAAP